MRPEEVRASAQKLRTLGLAPLALLWLACSSDRPSGASSATPTALPSAQRGASASPSGAGAVARPPPVLEQPPLYMENQGRAEFYIGQDGKRAPRVSMKGLEHAKRLVFLNVTGLGPWVRPFAELPVVSAISFSGTTATDDALVGLSGANLLELELAGSDVTDAGLAALTNLTKLKSLQLCGGRVTEAGIASLANVPSLESLDICHNDKLDGGGVERLSRLRVLLVRTSWSPDAYRHVAKMPALESLTVEDRSFDRTHMAALDGSAIARLVIRESSLDDPEIAAMPELPNLASLDIGSPLVELPLGNASLSRLASRTKLETIYITNANAITDEGAAAIAAMPNLRRLDLSFSSIGDEGAKALAALHLTKLDLWHTDIDDRGVAALERLGDLEDLNVGFTRATDACASSIAKLTKLKVLQASHVLSDEGLKRLGPLTNLRELYLISSDIEAAGIAAIATHNKLERLHLGCGKLPGSALAPLANLKSLRELYLDCASVDDGAVPILASMKWLEELNVVPTTISDAGRNRLSAALPDTSRF